MIVVVLGVMGAGKTTIAAALAARLGWRFLDADDFHSEANWARLERGEPLDDDARRPWLVRLRAELESLIDKNEHAVLACSALRASYRAALVPHSAATGEVRFVFLDADAGLLQQRLAARAGHRASAKLLVSQLETLEEPRDALRVSASESPERLVETIVEALDLAR